MEIKPTAGIGDVLLGMNMKEVRNILGQPHIIENYAAIDENPEDRSVIWEYEIGIELSFDSDENFALCNITCLSPYAHLENFKVVGITSKELLLKFPEIKLDDSFQLVIEEFQHRDKELSFWVENETVYAVTVYPEYDTSGNNVKWPKMLTNFRKNLNMNS